MTKSIEALAQEWGISEELAARWVENFAEVPEGLVRLSPASEPQMPYDAVFIGKSVPREDDEAPMTVGKAYQVEESSEIMAAIFGITRTTKDDNGEDTALPTGAMGQFAVLPVGGDSE